MKKYIIELINIQYIALSYTIISLQYMLYLLYAYIVHLVFTGKNCIYSSQFNLATA